MKNKGFLGKLLAVAVALLLWQAAALLLDIHFLLASPIDVFVKLIKLITDGSVLGTVWYSFSRIVLGFLLGASAGVMLGILAGRFRAVETLLWPYMVTVKSVPVASFIVIALIWLNSRVLSVFISFLIVLPIIYNNILGGIRGADRKMTQMADLFDIPLGKRIIYIWLPGLKSFLISSCQSAAGLAFKSGIAAEIIGIPSGSVGEQLYNAKVYFDTAELFAWTVLIVIASVIFERLFIALLSYGFSRLERL